MGRCSPRQNFMLYTVKESHTVFLRDVNFNTFLITCILQKFNLKFIYGCIIID